MSPGGAKPLTSPAGQGIHQTGAIYGLQAPTAFPARPASQWSSYLFRTAGPRIRVTLNDTLINDYTGTRNLTGNLALQAHTGTVQFRNLQARTTP